MVSDITANRVSIILLFAVTFAAIGYFTPVIYATYVPQENVIEQHSFTANDASVHQGSHQVCFDRTVHKASSGETITELYMVDGEGYRVSVDTDTTNRYFHSGRVKSIMSLDIPKNVEEGEYRYLLVIKLDMAGDRVVRTFTYRSDSFFISANVADGSLNRSAPC